MEKIKELTIVPDGKGKWLVVNESYRLHYECFCGGPVVPVLREPLKPLVGDGDHLVYNFGRWQHASLNSAATTRAMKSWKPIFPSPRPVLTRSCLRLS
jgi:hypothetical protein